MKFSSELHRKKLFGVLKTMLSMKKSPWKLFGIPKNPSRKRAEPNIPSGGKEINDETMAAGLTGNLNNPGNSRVNGNGC